MPHHVVTLEVEGEGATFSLDGQTSHWPWSQLAI
jgi:hypothetical protein